MKDLRATTQTSYKHRTGIRDLDDLWRQHGGKLSITGRGGLPLLYHIVDSCITELNGTVAIIDVDGRFSPSNLRCDLRHVHVWRPGRRNFKDTLESVEGYMLGGEHGSMRREWVATIVNGGAGGDIMLGWRGWLKVEKTDTVRFEVGMSVEEALANRERRQEVVHRSEWRIISDIGDFAWKEG